MVSEDKKVIQVVNPKNGREEILTISSSMNLRISKKIKERDDLLYRNMETWEKVMKLEEDKFISKSLEKMSDLREKVNEVKYGESDIEDRKKSLNNLVEKINEITDSLPDEYKEKKSLLVDNDEKILEMGYEIIKEAFRVSGGTPGGYNSDSEFLDDIIEEIEDINFFIDFFLTHSTSSTKSRSEQKFKVITK